jgi:probable O-glycosylation ligase (exosortase A-associated)
MEKGLLFTYALTYGGAAVSLFRPWYGLLIYICFAIIKPESLWYWSIQPGNYSRIVAIGLLIGWGLHGFGDWRMGKGRLVVLAMLGYLGWMAVSATQTPDPETAFVAVECMAKVVLPFLVGVTMVNSVAQLKQLAWVVVLSQGYVAYELNLMYLGGFNRVVELGFGGMDNNCVGIAMDTALGLALFLGMGATGRWWARLVALAAAGMMLHVVLFSQSRGGMLGAILTGAVAFVLLPKRPIHYAVAILGVAIALKMAGPETRERFATVFVDEAERDASAESRVVLWKACIEEMKTHPIFGVGPTQWGDAVVKYGFPRGKLAHTLWLQVGAELGVPGLGFLVLLYASCARRLWPYLRPSVPVCDPWVRDVARMVIASLVGFAVSAQFVSLDGLETPYYVAMLGAGALKLMSRWEAQAGAVGSAAAPAPVLVG